MTFSTTQKGFTLIELLIVIAIIGLLASIILVSFPNATRGARDAKRKHAIHQIQTALEVYYSLNDRNPLSGGASSPNSGWDNSGDSSWDNLELALAPEGILPKDPDNSGSGWAGSGRYVFNYYARSYGCEGQWYMLVYTLENKNDSDLLNSPGAEACSRTFNYNGTITTGMCRGCY